MPERTCTVSTCGKPSHKRGFCNAHYLKAWKYGDPLHQARPKKASCEVANCDRAPRSATSGSCEMHYYRNRRHGDPLAVRPIAGRTRTSNGYSLIHRPGHPLARPSGWVLEHRAVLFNAIGPGMHPCHWCGIQVAWHKQYPAALDALVVDHRDGDRMNNAVANLLPSCNPCNIARDQR